MINLILGAPGGGKSYEATVYHVLPAIKDQRLVITNLPLNFDVLEAEYPGCTELLIKVESTLDNPRPFSKICDYGNNWRHPETGVGPLYIIDEAHMSLPTQGVPREVEEWYAMHRHELADLLLMTQSYGKINKSIRELVQLVYRVRKNTALGDNNSYVRKIQDGLRGEVVNTDIRKYKSDKFKYYQSHTKSSKAATEAYAKDIKPIWQHWTFKAAAVFLLYAIYTAANGDLNPFGESDQLVDLPSPKVGHLKPKPRSKQPIEQPEIDPKELAIARAELEKKEKEAALKRQEHPLKKVQLHIEGNIETEEKNLYLLSASQNGQEVYKTSSDELVAMGYEITKKSPCLILIHYHEYDEWLTCDSPKVSLF